MGSQGPVTFQCVPQGQWTGEGAQEKVREGQGHNEGVAGIDPELPVGGKLNIFKQLQILLKRGNKNQTTFGWHSCLLAQTCDMSYSHLTDQLFESHNNKL